MGRKKILCFSTGIIIFIILLRTVFHVQLNPSEEWFTNINSCPACYGNSLCPQFYHGEISLIGTSKFKYLKFINSKNVYMGKMGRDRVTLKKLAHDWEINEKDILLCEKAHLDRFCDVKIAIELLVKASLSDKGTNKLVDVLKSVDIKTDLSHCPSDRLLSYMYSRISLQHTDFSFVDERQLFKLSEMMYGLLINPEAAILQTFSQAEGWPFPHFYGSCGRIIVEEYVGKTIAYFEDAPLEKRMDVAYQLLLIAQTLTENFSQFAFYMTDVNMDNFAVRSDGTVLLIDVENIVIVDRLVNKGKTSTNDFHYSKGEFCKDCLNFSFEDLCNCDLSDHNYYAICKGLLVPNSYYSSRGFLHNIPDSVNTVSNLSALIAECAEPSHSYGRFQVVPKILQVMKSLL